MANVDPVDVGSGVLSSLNSSSLLGPSEFAMLKFGRKLSNFTYVEERVVKIREQLD